MDSGSTEILLDAGCFQLYKDGHVDRLSGMDTVPAGFDADTGVTSKDVVIDAATGVSVRLYLPDVHAAESRDDTNIAATTKLPIVVFFHGGYFIVGSAGCPGNHRYLNSLAGDARVLVVSVDYRLAPEHPLPAAYDDSWAALNWTVIFPGARGGLDDPRMNPLAAGAPSLRTLPCERMLVCAASEDPRLPRERAYYEGVKSSGWRGDVEWFPASSSVAPTATSSRNTFAPKPPPQPPPLNPPPNSRRSQPRGHQTPSSAFSTRRLTPRLPSTNASASTLPTPNPSSPSPMEVEIKLRLPDAAAHRRLSSFLAPRLLRTDAQRNLFFDAAARPLAAATAALRIRLYGLQDQAPSRAVIALKRRPRIDAGVSRVEEVEEPLDPTLALACVDDPARLGGVDSSIVRLVSHEYGVGGDATPFVCLGGFRNTRGVYELEEGEGLGLVLELDETHFDFGTNYELECETAEPDQAKEVLQRLLTVAGVPYEYSRSNKFACFMAGKLLP